MRLGITPKRKRPNLFITNKEACILWKESAYYPKLRIMLGFALFAGRRISEIRPINIRDFKNGDFDKIDVILSKSHIKDEFPVFRQFSEYLKEWIKKNLHTFRDGYLFPKKSHNYNTSEPYLDKHTCNTMFYKFRKRILKLKNVDGSQKYPGFAEKVDYYDADDGRKHYHRHRIGWHSCRRWFETKLHEKGHSVKQIADIMRYSDPKTVYTYLDAYETWKKEAEIYEETFGDIFNDMMGFEQGQTKLAEFMS